MPYNWWDRFGGKINADGSWTMPSPLLETMAYDPYNLNLVYFTGYWHLTYTSQADPSQFGEWTVYGINLDLDGDGERDALDLAGLGFSWDVGTLVRMEECIWQDSDPSTVGGVGDTEVAFFQDAMRNAWPVK
jgi:hypothetical protein